jgi:hypothetical protein
MADGIFFFAFSSLHPSLCLAKKNTCKSLSLLLPLSHRLEVKEREEGHEEEEGLKQSSLEAPAEPCVTISLPNETPSFVRVTAPVGWMIYRDTTWFIFIF